MGLFGIKTKKDKQIEQLKREVEWLKGQEPIIIAKQRNIIALCGNYTVPDELEGEISQELIRQILSREIANKVTDYLDIYCDRDYMRRLTTYIARVDILVKGE